MSTGGWQERNRPPRLEKRYEFDDYETLRAFLDEAADLSEEKGLYPDIGFGRKHASFTIRPEEGSDVLTDTERNFAVLLDALDTAKQSS